MITKEDGEDFENFNFWICDNVYLKGNVKVKNLCYITRKYRGSAHRDCNIKS